MSLLEDVFLQDEANEAQELERVIEGDEYEGRERSDSENDVEKEDEAVEDKRRVDPTTTKTRVSKNPRSVLNPARLTGPRGIQVIPEHFKDFKFKGKGHEREDLDLILKKLEHWAYRLYPKFQFEDCLKKIETLGKKRPVMVHLHKIRTDQYLTEETVVQKDSSDEEAPPDDEFDKLLQQQIQLARSTPAPGSVKKMPNSPIKEHRSIIMPKATSSPSISDEQRERMLRNRRLAEEKRLARLKNIENTNVHTLDSQSKDVQETLSVQNCSDHNIDIMNKNQCTDNVDEVNTDKPTTRQNRSNIIDSSDEDEITTVNESIKADIHTDRTVKDNSIDNIEKSPNKNNENDNLIEMNKITEETPNSSNTDDATKHVTETNQDKYSEINEAKMDDIHNIITDNNTEVTNEDIIVINEPDQGEINKSITDNKIVQETDQDKVGQNDVEAVEDLMDVDFSDDF